MEAWSTKGGTFAGKDCRRDEGEDGVDEGWRLERSWGCLAEVGEGGREEESRVESGKDERRGRAPSRDPPSSLLPWQLGGAGPAYRVMLLVHLLVHPSTDLYAGRAFPHWPLAFMSGVAVSALQLPSSIDCNTTLKSCGWCWVEGPLSGSCGSWTYSTSVVSGCRGINSVPLQRCIHAIFLFFLNTFFAFFACVASLLHRPAD